MSVYKRKNNEWYCRFQINGERKHYKCNGAQNKTEALSIAINVLGKLATPAFIIYSNISHFYKIWCI